MIQKKNAKKRFLQFHIGAILFALIFPFYIRIAKRITAWFPGCFLHDFLFLYCPLCGGTRSAQALLRLDFRTAWQCNALVVILFAGAVVIDLLAFIRLLKGKEKLYTVPQWIFVVLAILLVGYGVLRNVLLIAYGIDPLGDLGPLWNG